MKIKAAFHHRMPVATLVLGLVLIWYVAAMFMNMPFLRDQAARAGQALTLSDIVVQSMQEARPVLPAPHQILAEIWDETMNKPITSKRSLVYHVWVTLSATLLGFGMGTVLGIGLAIAVVHDRVLQRSLMPWIIASQTIPILAIAPMVIVVLNAIGISGLLPKALISTYLSFFPVAVGMVKGLNSPDKLLIDLMRTYQASRAQCLFKLRLPASLPYLFTALKIAIAVSLVGAIVGELPTGAVAGLGARLLSGSYYGQTIQIWATLFTAAMLAASLVQLVDLAHRLTMRQMGAKPS